jgi:hypothetical protein
MSGAPPKHDWDAFAGGILVRLHRHGIQVMLGKFVCDMIDLFVGRGEFSRSDKWSLRQKSYSIWKQKIFQCNLLIWNMLNSGISRQTRK